MAIRKFNLMATSEIAEAPFRSLQEVDDYLLEQVKPKIDELDALIRQYQLQFSRTEIKSATTFEFQVNQRDPNEKKAVKFSVDKISKFVIPKMDTLRDNFGVVDELSEIVDGLDTLYNATAVKFRGVRGVNDILKNVKDAQRNAQVKMDKALVFLKSVGHKYAPNEFKVFVQKVMTEVQKDITFKDFQQFLYAYETKEKHLAFTYYIQLRGLKDDQGGIYPSFYIVFTNILKPSDDKTKLSSFYYATVMHEFATPGKFPLGKMTDTAAKAITALGTMLDLENVGSGIGTVPHGLDPEKWGPGKFSMAKRVAKITVDPASFTFDFIDAVEDDESKTLIQTLYTEMKGAWAHIKKAQIKVKPEKVGKHWRVRFTLTNLSGTDKVSTTDIDFLKEHFGLDDDKLRRVMREINQD